MEEKIETQEDLSKGGKFKNWLQDNIRIILSVLIVATIAVGIYSYSNRQVETVADNGQEKVNLAGEVKGGEEGVVTVEGQGEKKKKEEKKNSSQKLSVEEKKETEKAAEAKQKTEEGKKSQQAEGQAVKRVQKEENKNVSEETEHSFLETASAGDSLTTLARRALKDYLAKNPVEGLTPEHKIYIEDYLRRHVNHSSRVLVGEKISFSKDLIAQAVKASQNLSDTQLKNLHKYVVRVSNL